MSTRFAALLPLLIMCGLMVVVGFVTLFLGDRAKKKEKKRGE